MENSAASTAAFSRSESGTLAGSDSAAASASNTTTGSRAVGRQNRVSHRVSQIGHVIRRQLHLRRNYNRWFYRQLGMLVPYNHHGRSDLLHRQLRQLALACLQDVAIATTAATPDLCLGGF